MVVRIFVITHKSTLHTMSETRRHHYRTSRRKESTEKLSLELLHRTVCQISSYSIPWTDIIHWWAMPVRQKWSRIAWELCQRPSFPRLRSIVQLQATKHEISTKARLQKQSRRSNVLWPILSSKEPLGWRRCKFQISQRRSKCDQVCEIVSGIWYVEDNQLRDR